MTDIKLQCQGYSGSKTNTKIKIMLSHKRKRREGKKRKWNLAELLALPAHSPSFFFTNLKQPGGLPKRKFKLTLNPGALPGSTTRLQLKTRDCDCGDDSRRGGGTGIKLMVLIIAPLKAPLNFPNHNFWGRILAGKELSAPFWAKNTTNKKKSGTDGFPSLVHNIQR